MGFLSLFSRKSSIKNLANRGVKGQAYEATIASVPPLRGAYPVAGNGPNVLDNLSSTRLSKFSQSQTQLPTDVDLDLSAPAPAVPRFREEEQRIERPKTAPNGHSSSSSTSSWAKGFIDRRRNSIKGPPLSLKNLRDAPDVPPLPLPLQLPPRQPPKLPLQVVPSQGSQTPEFAQHGAGFTFPPPSRSAFSHHQRNSSMFSESGRSVDILDAQSEISRSDFRARVQAAGAKEYGEDVADRNLAENSFSIDSARVQAFYPSTQAGSKPVPNREFSLTAFPKAPKAKAQAQQVNDTKTAAQSSVPSALALRTNSLNSSSIRIFPHRTGSSIPVKVISSPSSQPALTKPNLGSSLLTTPMATRTPSRGPDHGRRLSVTAYVPRGSSSGVTSNASAKMRPLSLHRNALSGDDGDEYEYEDGYSHGVGYTTSNPPAVTKLPTRPTTSWDPETRVDYDVVAAVKPLRHYAPTRHGATDGKKKSRLPVAVPPGQPRGNDADDREAEGDRDGGLEGLRGLPDQLQFNFKFPTVYQPSFLGRPNSSSGSVPAPAFTSVAAAAVSAVGRGGRRPASSSSSSSRRHTLQALQISPLPSATPARRDVTMSAEIFLPSPSASAKAPRDQVQTGEVLGDPGGSSARLGGITATATGTKPRANGAESAPSPSVKSSHTRSDSYVRSRSMVYPRGGYLEEIYEHVPERTSSLRHWSLTSSAASPTTSSMSSNPFGLRPQSQHTANTSVDLSFANFFSQHHHKGGLSSSTTSLPLMLPPPSRGSVHSRPGTAAAAGPAGGKQLLPLLGGGGVVGIEPSPAAATLPSTADFNIDDYVSSDDDSLTGLPRHPRGAGEEHLLFRDGGYGFTQLPGLMESLEDNNDDDDDDDDGPLAAAAAAAASGPTVFGPPANRASLSLLLGMPATPPPLGGSSSGWERHGVNDDVDDDDHARPPRSPDSSLSSPAHHHQHRNRHHHHRHSVGVGVGGRHTTHGSPVRGRSRRRRFILDNGAEHPDRAPLQESHPRYGGAAWDVGGAIEEEEERRVVDVAAAVRLRKEAKARDRASRGRARRASTVVGGVGGGGDGGVAGKGKGKGKEPVPGPGAGRAARYRKSRDRARVAVEPDGDDADVE